MKDYKQNPSSVITAAAFIIFYNIVQEYFHMHSSCNRIMPHINLLCFC